MAYLRKVHQGVRGKVTDSAGNIVRALISVVSIDHPVVNGDDGWFYRPLAIGNYQVLCTSPLFPNQQLSVDVNITTDYEFVLHNFQFSS